MSILSNKHTRIVKYVYAYDLHVHYRRVYLAGRSRDRINLSQYCDQHHLPFDEIEDVFQLGREAPAIH